MDSFGLTKLTAVAVVAFVTMLPAGAQDVLQAAAGIGPGAQLARSPMDPTLERAEINYRARRLTAAMEQFGMIAAMHDHTFAWLRVGNILHRRGEVAGALDAYQRAQQAARQADRFAPLGARAVMNLALLGLDQAQLALEEMGGHGPAKATEPWIVEVQTRLAELTSALPASAGGAKTGMTRLSLAGDTPDGSQR